VITAEFEEKSCEFRLASSWNAATPKAFTLGEALENTRWYNFPHTGACIA